MYTYIYIANSLGTFSFNKIFSYNAMPKDNKAEKGYFKCKGHS